MKCELCKRIATDLHHKDENHKNNKADNLQYLCKQCHDKIHGIEPNYSELRRLVAFYTKTQKIRISINLSIRSFENIELLIPEDIKELSTNAVNLENKYSKDIKNFLKNNNQPIIYNWLKEIRGISHILSARLIALIDISKSPMVSSLWAYAGLTPDSIKRKGHKSNWNQELKMVCYQISDSFIKQRTPKYREIYDIEKTKQLKAELPRGHADNRARRKAVKIFLKDMWIEWNKLLK